MNKAIVDTTILTDVLLNSGEARSNANNALKQYSQTLLPVYAIKEFKSGPLKNFVWMHNKFALLGSYEKALDALQRMSRTPKRYTTSTAIQALKEAAGSIAKVTAGNLVDKYGEGATYDRIQCDELRLQIKIAIIKAWKKRRKVTTDIVCPLTCYKEIAPFEQRGLIELGLSECDKSNKCAMATLLMTKPDDLRLMRDAIVQSDKPENKRRAKILRQLYRTPKVPIENKDCRKLGDAIFVFIAPDDAVILTTNAVDHIPLAKAIGKQVVTPSEFIH
ncbi:MAG: hypothetical protein ABFD75_03495 [Smithella sp.]